RAPCAGRGDSPPSHRARCELHVCVLSPAPSRAAVPGTAGSLRSALRRPHLARAARSRRAPGPPAAVPAPPPPPPALPRAHPHAASSEVEPQMNADGRRCRSEPKHKGHEDTKSTKRKSTGAPTVRMRRSPAVNYRRHRRRVAPLFMRFPLSSCLRVFVVNPFPICVGCRVRGARETGPAPSAGPGQWRCVHLRFHILRLVGAVADERFDFVLETARLDRAV